MGTVDASSGQFTLAPGVEVDTLGRTVASRLERVSEYLDERQWEEAVETIRQVMEEAEESLIEVEPGRYLRADAYCRLRVTAFPPEALTLYRRRIDPVARQWFEQGLAERDRIALGKVVDQAFCSRFGDDASNALAEISLERGDFATARRAWERILPIEHVDGEVPRWLAYPDSDLSLASIRARLVLVSILEGDAERAQRELAALAELHPDARGRLGGVESDLAESLGRLLAESQHWPPRTERSGWSTFAGNPARDGRGAAEPRPGAVRWQREISPAPGDQRLRWSGARTGRRVAEDADRPLSYHPILVGNLLLYSTMTEIHAVDARTGEPAWGRASAVYRDRFDATVHESYYPIDTWGVPRFTLTAAAGRVFARMGSPVTTTRMTSDTSNPPRGVLVCLDMKAQGRLCWQIAPEEPGWAFDGTPVADDENVYVVMRLGDIRPRLYVACFDAETGARRWRSFVCAAETVTQGRLHEVTQTLLCRHEGTLYCNTNMGAVAALACESGRPLWVRLYPRVEQGDLREPAPHWLRDLTPPLYHGGTVVVAPSDSRDLLALDAHTGHVAWQSKGPLQEVIHLLGVVDGQVIASGERLYWIGMEGEDRGRILRYWPEADTGPGYGRGLLVGDTVYWPTRESVLMFDARDGKPRGRFSLVEHGITGGNLLAADGGLLVVDASRISLLGGAVGRGQPTSDVLTMRFD